MRRLTDSRLSGNSWKCPKSRDEYKSISVSEKPTITELYDRLCAIENILGEEYDLERLKDIVETSRNGRELKCCVRFTVSL